MSKKSSSVLEKLIPLATIQRKHRKEVEEMKAEGITAIQQIQNIQQDPEIYHLKENEERSALEISEKRKLEPLIKQLTNWINFELAPSRIIVKNLEEDLYDGQVLGHLLQKVTNGTAHVQPDEPCLGEASRKQNLRTVLDKIELVMSVSDDDKKKWKLESIYEKDLISILHLLVAMAGFFRPDEVSLPEDLSVKVIVIQQKKQLEKKTVVERITGEGNEAKKRDRDAFDTLFDHAPDKLDLVKNSLLTFLRKHLAKIDVSLDCLDPEEIKNGVILIKLMGILEGYYIAEWAYNADGCDKLENRVENCRLLFELIEEAGLQKPNCLPEEIASGDLKSIMRTLYTLFSKYKERD